MRAHPLTAAQTQVLDYLREIGLVGAASMRSFSASTTLTPRTLLHADETFKGQFTLVSAPDTVRRAVLLPVLQVAGLGVDPTPGAASADLTVEGLLGEGGMGWVHSARQHSLGRSVAIKTLKEPDEDARTSLLTEGMISGALEHPGIVPVHALGLTPSGDPVLVMKRVEGQTLKEMIDACQRDGTAEGRRVEQIEILMAVCNAVHFAHTHGVLHRDIKPSNIMLGRFGEVYLVDWGIATRLGAPAAAPTERACTETFKMIGTPAFMAPEMARTGILDARTDVYLLGATLHMILTGKPRHLGDSWLEVIYSAVESEPPEYGDTIPKELGAIARRATHRDPAMRHETALELREDLARYVRLHTVLDLVRAAEERLERSSQLLGDGHEAAPRETLRSVLLECRFAFGQALREAPEHEGARRGLRTCLLTMIDQELWDGNVDAAHALLGEVDDAPRPLVERVEQAVHERDRLRAVAAELDLSVSGKQRRRVMLVGGVALLAACVWTLLIHTPSHEGLIGTAVLNFTLAVVLPLLTRGSLGSAVNQRIRTTWLSTATMFLLGRLVGAGLGIPPHAVIAMEQVALAGVVAVFAAAWLPSLWTAATVLALGAVVATVAPRLAGPTFVLTSTLGMIGSAMARGRSLPRRPRGGRGARPR